MATYRHHRETTVTVAAPAAAVFALLDDPARLGAHMGRRSAMMAGATMHTETDAQGGQAIGSVIRMHGRFWGLTLSLEESVVERLPLQRKVWETMGEPHLLVIGRYRMGFALAAVASGTQVRLWIDYDLPLKRWPHALGRLLGSTYADWCLRQMVREVANVPSITRMR